MIAACPSCSTRFVVPDEAMAGGGRKVRCGRCGHVWLQQADGGAAEAAAPAPAPAAPAPEPPPPAPEPVAEAPPEPVAAPPPPEPPQPEPETDEPKAAAGETLPGPNKIDPSPASPPAAAVPRRQQEKRRRRWPAAAAILALLAFAALGGAVALKPEMLGQMASLRGELAARLGTELGLGLDNVTTERSVRDGVPVLVVRGEVVNTTRGPRDIPPLKGVLHGPDKRALQDWTFRAPAPRISAGARVAFETTLSAPAAGATDLSVTFAVPGI